MRKPFVGLSSILVLMVILACSPCGFLSSTPTETPTALAPKATNTPKPEPKPSNTPTPAPTPTGAPDVNFSVDRTRIREGECVTFYWKVENVKEVYFYQEGDRWQNHGVAGEGQQQECPPATTNFYLRVVKPDDVVDVRQMTITVDPASPADTPEPQNPLAGTSWQVESYHDPNSPGGLAPVLAGTSLTVAFGHDGRVTGSAGCNDYSASYLVDGVQLAITPPTATSKGCEQPQGIMEQEDAFLDNLAAAGHYKVEGNKLSIVDATGFLILDLSTQY